jgi:hypothetical protein
MAACASNPPNTKTSVGASLLANAVVQSTYSLNVNPLSLAGQLPQLIVFQAINRR